MKPIAPEQVKRAVEQIMQAGGITSLEIQTHYGNHALRVSEIWADAGTLRVSVFQPETN
jgi:hypothetical protein